MPDLLDRLKAGLADRYVIQEEIGAGGMATVYLARDVKHERKVAVKILRPELAAALGADRFLREVKITASLTHPHILPLLDSGEVKGFLYYVMPYVEGESLRELITREKLLALDDAVRIAREVADALGSAHNHDVVHRDIKPENILLEEGHAVVADFGVARAISEAGGERLTVTGLSIGTPAYMSPEQCSGGAEIDGRSDIYSLGCVLYEMLAGHPPFTGATAQEIMIRHATDPVPTIRAARSSIPEGVERAVYKALEKVPADRFATAQQFVEALSQDEVDTVPVRSGIGRKTVQARSAGRRKVVGFLAAVLALGAAAGLGGKFLSFGGSSRSGGALTSDELPLVIIMDSPHPSRVYDEETRAASGTNADVISDILLDLPIRRQREPIGPDWHRDEEILRFDPDLIVIHYSGFRQEDGSGPRERLKVLVTFFADSETKFLIYSRRREAGLEAGLDSLLGDLYLEHPGLAQRVRAFGVIDHGPPRWINTVTASHLKLAVKGILDLR